MHKRKKIKIPNSQPSEKTTSDSKENPQLVIDLAEQSQPKRSKQVDSSETEEAVNSPLPEFLIPSYLLEQTPNFSTPESTDPENPWGKVGEKSPPLTPKAQLQLIEKFTEQTNAFELEEKDGLKNKRR